MATLVDLGYKAGKCSLSFPFRAVDCALHVALLGCTRIATDVHAQAPSFWATFLHVASHWQPPFRVDCQLDCQTIGLPSNPERIGPLIWIYIARSEGFEPPTF